VRELANNFTPGELPVSETEQKEFINLYNKILRLRNILLSFDDFLDNELIAPGDYQDYQSTYLLLHQRFRDLEKGDKESIIDDLVFEIELVKQVEINVDYILILVRSLQGASVDENKEIKAKINKTVLSSYTLRSKKDLIERFVESINNTTDVESYWREFIDAEKNAELEAIIKEENLNAAATKDFVSKAFLEGELKTAGTVVTALLPAKNMFSPSYEHSIQKASVIEKLKLFFDRFSNL
jgi:type I restriction enzyme R subunit